MHVVWKFPEEAVMEGSQPDTVSLLQQEIANCAFNIQQIKVSLKRLSSPKTKEQLNQYNKCVEQLEKQENSTSHSTRNSKNCNHCYCKGKFFGYLLALLDFCLGLRMHREVHT